MPDVSALKSQKVKKTKEVVDYGLFAHLERIGCESVAQYQRWCLDAGFLERTSKTERERHQEIKHYKRSCSDAALYAARRFERHPDEVLRALARGDSGGVDLQRRPYLAEIKRLFAESRWGPSVRDMFLRLLLHTHKVARLETLEPVVEGHRSRCGDYNTYPAALLALARHHKHWLQEPETWKPTTHRPRQQFAELARHLLCRYAPPPFLIRPCFWIGRKREPCIKNGLSRREPV